MFDAPDHVEVEDQRLTIVTYQPNLHAVMITIWAHAQEQQVMEAPNAAISNHSTRMQSQSSDMILVQDEQMRIVQSDEQSSPPSRAVAFP